MDELKSRVSPRWKGFDYGKNGVYFITVCVEKRRNILSKIVGEGSPLPQLSDYGAVVDGVIKSVPKVYPFVKIDNYVIMPNHIHLLLSFLKDDGRGDPSPTVADVLGWFKYNATKQINEISGTNGNRVFQRSFYDHVVRNMDESCALSKYISDNPKRWYFDELYCED